MSITIQDQRDFFSIGQAMRNVLAGVTADVNTYALAFGATWSSAAQNPANWPAAREVTIDRAGVTYIKLRFLVADTDGDAGTVTIWRQDGPTSAPMNDLVITATAGTAVCDKLPGSGLSLTHIPFDTGAKEIEIGDQLYGETSGALGTVEDIIVTSGSWGGGDAAGVIYLSGVSGTWQSENITAAKRAAPRIYFNTGDNGNFAVGDVLYGSTSGATARITAITVTSGSWAAGTAAGYADVEMLSGIFQAGETLGETTGNTTAKLGQDGAAACTGALRQYRYADTLTISTDHVNSVDYGTDGADGIREVSYDLRGGLKLFCDFDMNASGTAGTDMIVLAKFY